MKLTSNSAFAKATTAVIEAAVPKVALCGDTTYVWRFSAARSYYT